MSTMEILEELPRLAREEREKVWQRLEEIELGELDETPEQLAAIDAGRRSVNGGKVVNVEAARSRIKQWTTK
jgi:predicted transcriptional regulator